MPVRNFECAYYVETTAERCARYYYKSLYFAIAYYFIYLYFMLVFCCRMPFIIASSFFLSILFISYITITHFLSNSLAWFILLLVLPYSIIWLGLFIFVCFLLPFNVNECLYTTSFNLISSLFLSLYFSISVVMVAAVMLVAVLFAIEREWPLPPVLRLTYATFLDSM